MNPKNFHILNRFGFGPKIKWLDNPSTKKLLNDPNYLIDWLLNSIPKIEELKIHNEIYSDCKTSKSTDTWRQKWPSATKRADWIKTLSVLDNPLNEKLALFWNHYIPISIGIWDFAQDLLIDAYRQNALSDFPTLLNAVSESPCSMKFLNAYHSKKKQPNQNFARELLELFTVGVDNYSQLDVEEVARAFTGRRTVSPDNFELPYPYKMYIDEYEYDSGEKYILGEKGNWNGNDAINILINQPATASKLAKGFLMFFVSDNPKSEHINELSQHLLKSNFNTLETIKFILQSDWFYCKEYMNSKVKTPVELWVSFLRKLNVKVHTTKSHLFATKSFGQNIFYPPNVGGWPWGKGWLHGSSLQYRIFLNAAFIEISENNNQITEPSAVEKLQFRLFKKHLMGFKYENKIQFDVNLINNLLNENELTQSQWLLDIEPITNINTIQELIQHPKFQFH